jgi:DNA-binding transcriptional regulator YhcF (GntR family)
MVFPGGALCNANKKLCHVLFFLHIKYVVILLQSKKLFLIIWIYMKTRKTPVLSETIKKLRTIIQEHSNVRLPSVRTLAQRCAVSPVTILRAITILKGEGLLEGDWGRGNYITTKKASLKLIEDHQSISTVEKTVLMIKNDIIEGKYQTHHPSPPA